MGKVDIFYTSINPKKNDTYDAHKLKEIFGEIGECNTGDILCVDNCYRNFGLYIIIIKNQKDKYITQFSFNIKGVDDSFSDYGILLPINTYKKNMSLYGYIFYQPVLIDELLSECKKITKLEKLEKLRDWYVYIEYDSNKFIENYDDSNLEYAYRIFNVDDVLQLQRIDICTLEIYNDEPIILSPLI